MEVPQELFFLLLGSVSIELKVEQGSITVTWAQFFLGKDIFLTSASRIFLPKIFTYKKAIFRHMASKILLQYYQNFNGNTD